MKSELDASRRKKIRTIIISLAIIVLFSLTIHSSSLDVADLDSFYHIRHSWIYSQEGITSSEFPWTQFSLIKQYGADLWYGFHVIAIPLTYFDDLTVGIWLGGLLVTTLSLTLIWIGLCRLPVKWPLVWTLIISILSADFLFRLTMFRPHPISVGLTVLLFSLFCLPPSRRSFVWIALSSFFFAWLHLSLIWLPIALWITISLIRLILRSPIGWAGGLASISGILLGWVLRPHPIGAAKLAYAQVLQLLFEKKAHLPLSFGQELLPLARETIVDQLIPILALLLIAIFFWVRTIFKNKWQLLSLETRIIAFGSFVLSAVFFVLSLAVARRSIDFFIPFAGVLLMITYSHVNRDERRMILGRAGATIVAVAFIIIFGAFLKNYYRFESYLPHAFSPTRFEEAGRWMKDNLPAKKIVFVPQWDYFPEFFFWNQNNYYINGMDPIFEFAYDPSLYWKTHFLATDKFYIDNGVAKVCGEIGCTAENLQDIRTILKVDFGTEYILVDKPSNPKLYAFLETAAGFQKLHDNSRVVIYKVL